MYDGGGYHYRSRPLAAHGGIKVGATLFGESWWAKRWLQALRQCSIGTRLTRGVTYARSGQVLPIEIEPGRAVALVQGTRRRPYEVTIQVRALSPKEGEKVAAALAKRPLLAARLLAGEMPPDLEQVFSEAHCSLFPSAQDDLKTSCSCPDWANPCKHTAAVYYLLGREFDRDPFLLLRLRGLDRRQLLEALKQQLANREDTANDQRSGSQGAAAKGRVPEPLPEDPTDYWRESSTGRANPSRGTTTDLQETGGPAKEAADEKQSTLKGIDDKALSLLRRVLAAHDPSQTAAIPRQLGDPPFWRGAKPLEGELTRLYQALADAAVELLSGERTEADAP